MSDTQTSAEAPRDTGVVNHDNPWPGLAAFREDDQAFFHGRDEAIAALTELVTRARLSVLYGVSGLGKTSLVQAGLFPRARALDLFPVRIRLGLTPSSEPLADQVCVALTREAAERQIKAPVRDGAETLWEFFYRKDALWWNKRHHLLTPLLVFDQFEEIFTIGRRHADVARGLQQFLGDLRGIILGSPPDAVKARCDADPDQALRYSLSRCPVRVLFSFREDYLAEFLELRDAFPAIGEQNYRLLRMSTDDALAVVRKAGGHLVDDAVARRIVEIIAAAKSARTRAPSDLVVDPALLSVFCRELNNERRSKPQDTITDDLLQDKQARILENFYARSFEGLDPGVQVFVENELLLPDSAERNSVAEQVALRRPGVTAEAIESLIERRLLRRDERDGPPRLELTHDVLIEPTRRSRDARLVREAEERRLAVARATEEESRKAAAEAQERERQELLLQVERAKAERAASELLSQRDMRRRVQNFLGIAAALALLAAFGWYRAYQEGTRTKRALATSGLIQASSKYEAEGRNDIALAYLGYAARLDPTNTYTRGKLVDSLLHRTWPVPLAILRHEGAVGWAQFAADGTRVLTASADGAGVRLWPAGPPSKEPVRTLGAPAALARVDAKGRYAIAITIEGTVEVWDGATGRTVRKIESERVKVKLDDGSDELDKITIASLDGAATFIATGTQRGVIRLWRITAAEPTPVWTNAEDPRDVGVLQFNDDGSRLLTWSLSGLARILDVPTGEELATFSDIGLFDAQFAPGAPYLVTASDSSVRLWKLPEDAPIRGRRRTRTKAASLLDVAVVHHEGAVRSARFSPDGTRIVSASDDGTARIWKLDVVRPSPGIVNYVIGSVTPPLRHRRGVVTAFFSADGSRVVTASRDTSARVWDAESGAPLTEPLWHDEGLGSAMFSADAQRVVTASDDGTAKVWDVRPGSAVPDMLHSDLPLAAQFTPDGSALLLSDSVQTKIWKLATGQVTQGPSHSGGFLPLFNEDGTTFLTVDATGDGYEARTWTAATAEPSSAPMRQGSLSIWAARFSPGGDRIAILTGDGNVRFWNARSGTALDAPIELVREKDRQLLAVDFSRDLQLVALGTTRHGDQNNVVVWDLSRNPAVLVTELATPSPVKTVSFDPQHNRLLGIFDGDTALVWPVGSSPSGPPAKLAHDGVIVTGRFSPDGERIATASRDSTARIWTYAAGAFRPTVLRHDQSVESVDFSPDGLRIVTASRDGTARLWDAATGSPASLPLMHAGSRVLSSRFSADGEKLVTTCEDGVTRVWHVPVGQPEDVTSFASLAEAASGYEVRVDGTVVRLPDQITRLDTERRTMDSAGGTKTLPHRIGEWVLADRWNRNISPFSTTPIERYLRERLADGTDDGRSVGRLYAGHPALRGKAGGQP